MSSRCILYIRQSITKTDDPADSISLAFQERTLRQMVERLDGTVLEPPIIDPDEKGWDPKRPGIEDLIQRVEREKPDYLAVYAVSRFARDNWLQEGIWRRLKALHPGLTFVSATEPHAEDDLVRGILGVVSQAERKRMGTFLSSAFRERARRGLPHGRVPFGFVKGSDGRLIVNEDARPYVLAICDHLEAGRSLWWIAREYNRLGVDGRTWEPNVVRNTVRTPAIAGGVRTADVLTWEAHEPIIGRDRWERLCTLLETRRQIRSKPSSSWLEGLIYCGCGAPMHLIYNRPKSGNGSAQFRCAASPNRERFQRRSYLVCTFRPRSITQAAAELLTLQAITTALQGLVTPEDAYRRATAHFARLERSRTTSRAQLERQMVKAERERERLLVLYRRATLDVERWEAQDAELAATLDTLSAQLDEMDTPPDLAVLQREHERLAGLGAALAVDPSLARRVLMELGADVQRTTDGVRVRWPGAVAALLDDVM